MQDIASITSLPDSAPHRPVDKLILSAATEHGLKTAIVCPPDIYGKGSGPGKTRSIFLPVFVDLIKNKVGSSFYVGEGANTKGWVHVQDLMKVYLGLVEDAAKGGKNADWGEEVRRSCFFPARLIVSDGMIRRVTTSRPRKNIPILQSQRESES